MYLKDAVASDDQFFDLEAEKASDRLAQVLNIPVTDFELSVRSRNCLQKMGIMTLGDLARTTEQTLLSSKNFGETSLVEINEMLSSKQNCNPDKNKKKLTTNSREGFAPPNIHLNEKA